MPKFQTGQKLNIDRGTVFAELKSKGEKIHFRVIGNEYQYDGKHFFQKDGKWIVTFCPRVMNDLECQHCEKYFAIRNQAKAEEDKKKKEVLLKEANLFKATVKFYYPIIDREKQEARIFKASLSTRIYFNQEHENGLDIVDYDYIVTRTEIPGSGYYSVTRLDSKQTKPLTEKEQQEIEKIKRWNLEEMVTGMSSKIVKTEEEA